MHRNKVATMLGAAAFLMLSSGASSAQEADMAADVRCAAVGMKLGTSDDPKVKNSALMLTIYFLGKLDGRDPHLDLESAFVREILHMTASDFASEQARCGQALAARGQTLVVLGQALVKRGQQAP